jgi:soluble lytic murein transglycosylase-like protein
VNLLIDIARERALSHGLQPELVCALIEQESTWRPWAIRYEPAFFQRYIVTMNFPNISEGIARATSWGLCQVMGQTARELGFAETYLSQLCDPWVGIHYGCMKLRECYAKTGIDDAAALQRYNGGGNLKYSAQVLARVHTYQL